MEYEIEFEGGLARVTAWGKALDEVGFVAFLRELVAHPRWELGLPVLVDYLRVDARELALDAVAKIADATRAERRLERSRCAFVVESTLGYGLTRQYEGRLGSDSLQTAVFLDLVSAERWLRESLGSGAAEGAPAR